MDKTDDLIERALSAEDRALLASHGEPGYISQALGLFRTDSPYPVLILCTTSMLLVAAFEYSRSVQAP